MHLSEGAIQLVRYIFFTGSATPGSPENRVTARRTVITHTFRPGPFFTAFFIAIFGNFLPPDGNRSFHHPDTGRKTEILDFAARPFLTLMAGIEPL